MRGEGTSKLGLIRLGRERTSQLSTFASQSHLCKRSRIVLIFFSPNITSVNYVDYRPLSPPSSLSNMWTAPYVWRSMSKKRPPGHLRGPSLKLPVPGSLSQVATSLQPGVLSIESRTIISLGFTTFNWFVSFNGLTSFTRFSGSTCMTHDGACPCPFDRHASQGLSFRINFPAVAWVH